MSISIYLSPISHGKELVIRLLQDEFNVELENAEYLFNSGVKQHFDNLKENIYLLAESHYVDKVYRDSYYHYYSSKLRSYNRDCIRISFFEGKISGSDFGNYEKHETLQKQYRGFMVIRPIDPYIIGRSIISPLALKSNNFICCTTKFQTTANSQKFYIEGFPHSSQDTETISCAETSLWAIMEYFSNKYSEYQPVLPSKIIQTLYKVTTERQVPSKGLNINQMSFALREFGFGTRVYSRVQYGGEFESLLSCYVESGIPVIVAMENRPTGNIGHALIAIGHVKLDENNIDKAPIISVEEKFQDFLDEKNITIFDYDSVKKEFVFIDDNMPVYQRAYLDNPAIHYDAKWKGCKITFFIVPLYPKIYLEAFEAKNFILRFLTIGPEPLTNNSTVLIRFFLTSSRSFKDEIGKNETVQEDIKGLLLETSMPKFIWVAEITSKTLIKQKKANGMVILDATEANINFNKPLIIAFYQSKLVFFDQNTGILERNLLPLSDFKIFEHNLNAF